MEFKQIHTIDKDWLYQKHYIEKQSTEKIGKLVGCSGRNIRYRLRLLGFRSILNDSENRKGIPNPKNKYPRTEKQLYTLRTNTLGVAPWNKGTHGVMPIPWNKGKNSFKFNCKICGKKVVSNKNIRLYKFCSATCRNMYSRIMRGENHWNYKGENNKIQRCWSQYREWHKEVLKKADYTCAICGKKGGRLQAHHIKGFADYPELRFDVSNGMCTCKPCHLIKIHKWKTTEERCTAGPKTWKRVALSNY